MAFGGTRGRLLVAVALTLAVLPVSIDCAAEIRGTKWAILRRAAQSYERKQGTKLRASAKLSEAHVAAPPPQHEVQPPSPSEDEVSPLIPSEDEVSAPSHPEPQVPPPGKFDLVLAHYSHSTIEKTTEWWSGFLDIEMVREMKPRVFVYCQNPDLKNLSAFQPLLKHGGRIVHLDNKGREGRVYLHHITQNYNQLSAHTLFSQDIPVDDKLWHRFQNMFEPRTGYLPLAYVAHQECENGWLPTGQMPQLFAMFTTKLCPPEGFTASFNGQFLVSRPRILRHSWWVYQHLLEFVTAPEEHWIHEMHDDVHFKTPDNPKFGHVLERAWSLIFDCWDYWRDGNCQTCDHQHQMLNCGGDACQCYDRPEHPQSV